jgi:hypothetical protein
MQPDVTPCRDRARQSRLGEGGIIFLGLIIPGLKLQEKYRDSNHAGRHGTDQDCCPHMVYRNPRR